MSNNVEIKCKGCGKTPEELPEYKTIAIAEGYDSATIACMVEKVHIIELQELSIAVHVTLRQECL